MFCMCIDIGCVDTGEGNVYSVCVLTEVSLLKGRVSYVLYVYFHMVRCYRGGQVMFCMCTDRRYNVTS